MTEIRLVHLPDAADKIAVLEQWFIQEWEPWYGPAGQGDASADLTACLVRDQLPSCLLALNSGDEVVGTASLKHESAGSERGVGPWLSAVLVHKEHRRQGIGTSLVGAVENEAVRLGYSQIFTSTDTADGILSRRGWTRFGTTSSLRGPLAIYRWTAQR